MLESRCVIVVLCCRLVPTAIASSCLVNQWIHSGVCFPCEGGKFSQAGGETSCTDCPTGKIRAPGSNLACENCPAGKFEVLGSSCQDCNSGKVSQAGASSCDTCMGGKYSDTSTWQCEECAAGKYATMESKECLNCIPGKSSPKGMEFCNECNAGRAAGEGAADCQICSEGFFSPMGGTECSPCKPGRVAAQEAYQCDSCTAGKFADVNSLSSCQLCPAGEFSIHEALQCIACVAGKSSSEGSDLCTDCEAGKFSFGGQEHCTQCAAGKFAEAGRDYCFDCAAGKAPSNDHSSCETCDSGKFALGGAAACEDCPVGRFADRGQGYCDTCVKGTVAPPQSGMCTECTAGKYTSADKGECLSCPGGTFSLKKSDQCTPCEAGTYAGNESGTCSVCPGGKFAPKQAVSCTACAAGKYAEAGSGQCFACAAGKVPSSDSSSCDTCDAGKFAPGGAAACEDCSAGRFAERGQGYCDTCVKGTVAPPQSGTCTECTAGKYTSPSNDECLICIAGTFSLKKSDQCTPCEAGTYAGNESGMCLDCPGGKSAPKMAESCTECAAGTFAEAASGQCSDCVAGSAASNGSSFCQSCDSGKAAPYKSATCEICPAGRFAGVGKGQCEECAKGAIAQAQSGICTNCAAGKYTSQQGDECLISPPGTFAAPKSSTYTSCEAGTYAPSQSNVCSNCPAGTYSGTGAAECTGCPAGKYSIGIKQKSSDTCVDCPADTYNSLTGQGAAAACRQCPANSQTLGVAETGMARCFCLPGYGYTISGSGFLCNACEAGNYKEGQNHNPCSSCDQITLGSTSAVASILSSACHCPPGLYKTRTGCKDCPVGFYCPGTISDDSRYSCPVGATTLSDKAITSTACLCVEGYNRFNGACVQCLAGRYKDQISNDAICSGVCADIAENSTSAIGSRSNSSCVCKPNHFDPTPDDGILQCVEAEDGTQATGSTSLTVPSVQSEITLKGVKAPVSDDDKVKVAQTLADKVVEMLGIDMTPICAFKTQTASQDIFACGDIDVSLNRTSSRRLSSSDGGDAVHASFVVRRSTQKEASIAASLFEPERLADLLPKNDALFSGLTNVSAVSAPVTRSAITSCPAGKAFPVGVGFVSLQTSCKCRAGYEPAGDGMSCTPCRFDFWKSVAKDSQCDICPENRKTLAAGTDTRSNCYCAAGFYADSNKDCVTCPANAYCPFDENDDFVPCGTGQKTIGDGKISQDSCLCEPGWGVANLIECERCASGSYKSTIDNAPCADCPQASIMMSEIGATKVEDCACIPGYFYDYKKQSCEACHVPGITCKGGFYKYGSPRITLSIRVANIDYATLSSSQISGVESNGRDVLLEELNNSVSPSDIQIIVESGSVVLNATITLSVDADPSQTHSSLLASSTLIPALATQLNAISGVIVATSSISIRNSSYYGQVGSIDQVRPYAKPGHYLTGVLRVIKCADSSKFVGSVCLGGNESGRPCNKGCNCIPGMDGFKCENCIPGYTRKDNTVDCRKCDALGPSWWMIGQLAASAIFTGALYLVLTALAVAAGASAKRVHTALLRMWQSWVLSMVVLKQFNLSDLAMFSWGEEQAKIAYMKENPEASPQQTEGAMAKMGFGWPTWFKPLADVLYGLSEFVPAVGQPAENLQCLAENFMSKEAAADGKYIFVSVWWAIYPALILLITYILSALVVYCIYPPLDRRGMFPPSDPRLFKSWAFEKVRPTLEKTVRMMGCMEEDVDNVMADMKSLLSVLTLTLPQIEKMAGNPIGGIRTVSGRLNVTSKLTARRIVITIYKKRLVDMVKKAVTKIVPAKESGDADESEAQNHKRSPTQMMWMNPWSKKCEAAIPKLLEALPIDSLIDKLKAGAPSEFMRELLGQSAIMTEAVIVEALALPIFRLTLLKYDEEIDLEGVDEMWGFVAKAFLTNMDAFMNFNPTEILNTIGQSFGGQIASVIWAMKDKRRFLEVMKTKDPELSEEDLKKKWSSVIAFVGRMEIFKIRQLSYEEIIASAGIESGNANKADQETIAKMREEQENIDNAALLDTAEAMSETSFDVKTDVDYCILGIWRRSPTFLQFLGDSKPLCYLAMYTLWYQVAKELLGQINCDAFPVELDSGLTDIQQRWVYHTDYLCFEGPHLKMGLTACAGLAIWSFGFMFFLGYMVYKNRRKIAEPEVQRVYAYFVQGYELEYCQWDVLVKRLDLLCTILISSTNIAKDKKAKLLLYACLAALMLGMHAWAKPFDNRKGELLDRFEFVGLSVRFLTFSVIELCLVFNPALPVAIAGIGLVALATAWYAVRMWVTIIVEYIADLSGSGQKGSADDIMKMMDEGTAAAKPPTNVQGMVANKLKKSFKWIAGFACKSVIAFVYKMMVKVTSKVQALESSALSLHFGKNCELQIMCREEHEGLVQAGMQSLIGKKTAKGAKRALSLFFHQSNDDQREFLSIVIGAYYTHVICTMESQSLPPRSLECFLAMSASLKMSKLDGEIKPDAAMKDKYNAMLRHTPEMVRLMFSQGSLHKDMLSSKLQAKKMEAAEEEIARKKSSKSQSSKSDIESAERPLARSNSAVSKVSDIYHRALSSDDIVETLTAQELETVLDSMSLRAEELNETLMVLTRVPLAQSKVLFDKVVKCFEHRAFDHVRKSMSELPETAPEPSPVLQNDNEPPGQALISSEIGCATNLCTEPGKEEEQEVLWAI